MKSGLLALLIVLAGCFLFAQEQLRPSPGPYKPDSVILAKQVLELQAQLTELNGRVKKLERENGYRILPLQNVITEPSRK